MSKLLLHYVTAIGPRTIVAEIADAATAQAVVNAHLAMGEMASLVEEMPRTSLKAHMAKHHKNRARVAQRTIESDTKVTRIDKARARA